MLSLRGRSLAGPLALLALAAAAAPVVAQELPACDPSLPASGCQLPTWPDGTQVDAPSRFGPVTDTVWVTDATGDAGVAGVDIQAVGIGSVDIADAAVLRRDPEVLRRGRRNQAVRSGENTLVRIVIDRPLDQLTDGHAGIHVATDIDRSRTNNAPVGVSSRPQPFGGSEDVYSIVHATTNGRTQLLDSDLARGWFRDRDAFAAAWAAPNVLDVLIRPEGLGDQLRVVSYASVDDAGYDVVDLGVAGIPLDGQVGLRPACVEAGISADPYTVRRLVENGQTLRNVETPASWLGGAAFRLDPETRTTLEAFMAATDEDGDGRVELPSSVDLFEDGAVIGQRPELSLALAGDTAQLAVQLGLTRRGFDVVRQLTPEATGDATVDAWLTDASDALTRTLPPFRVGRRGGQLVGAGPGSCLDALVEPPPPEPAASAAPASVAPASAAPASAPLASGATASPDADAG